MQKKIEIDISAWTVIKIVLVLLGFYLVYLIKDIIILLLFAIILSATFRPVINKWEKKIKRVPAVLSLLLIIIIITAFIIYIIFPPLISQLREFIQNAPNLVDKYPFLSSYKDLIQTSAKSLAGNIGGLTGSFVNATLSIFGGIFTVIITVVLTIYLLLDREGFRKFIVSSVPTKSQEAILELARKMATKMGDWFRGQLFLCFTVGVIDFIGLTIIGIPYALTLALISGLLDFIPTIGPLIAGTIAFLIALTVSPIQAVIVVVLYILVQQLENSLLVPKIMQKAVGLSPVIIIISVVTGAKLLGLIGALLAVPLSALISVLIHEWPNIRATFNQQNTQEG